MKRVLFLLCMLVFMNLMDGYSIENRMDDVERIIEGRQFFQIEGRLKMADILKDESFANKLDFYQSHQMNPLWGFGLNFVVPSLGSWLQKDYVGAIVTDAGVYGVGGVSLYLLIMGSLAIASPDQTVESFNTGYSQRVTGAVGLVVAGIFEIANLIYPFVYSSSFNDKLSRSIMGIVDDASPGNSLLAFRPKAQDNWLEINLVNIRF